MVITYLLFIIGIALLMKGADYLINGSSSLAKKYGVPTLVIGLTIVAFGTSLPELVVNIFAGLKGESDVALGNIIGSNIANLLLILGISALICPVPMKVQSSTTWKEIPFSLLAAVVLFIFASSFLTKTNPAVLNISSGLILLCFFVVFLFYVVSMSLKKKEKDKKLEIQKHSNFVIFLMIVGGLAMLYFGGKWVVNGAVGVARLMGFSEYLISATIVAVGTSLPELVTSIVAARKKDVDLAVGNVVGSNIFNIFFILGITALITPLIVPAAIFYDIVILMAITFLLFIFMFVGKRHVLEKWQGVLFLVLYVMYVAMLVIKG